MRNSFGGTESLLSPPTKPGLLCCSGVPSEPARGWHCLWQQCGLQRSETALAVIGSHLLHIIRREFISNVGLNGSSRGDITVCFGNLAKPFLANAAPVERACQLRLQLQRRIIVSHCQAV